MSTRQLRKLQKQRELEREKEISEQPQESEESDQDEAPAASGKPRVSLFAALGGDEGGDNDIDEEEEDDAADQEENEALKEAISPPATKSKKSKKKKKKKDKAKPAALLDPPTDQKDQQDQVGQEDEIDRAIKELKLTTQPGGIAGASHEGGSHEVTRGQSHTSRLNSLLRISTQHLKAFNEMRSLFGRDIIDSAHNEEVDEARRANRRGHVPRQMDLETFLKEPPGAKKLPEVTLRRNVFIQGRDHWPRQSTGGLTMKEVRKDQEKGEWTEYQYGWDKNYDSLQAVFFGYVQAGDPMRMVYLLKEIPYHVSTLLQVSSVAKQDQNMALAAELCERALFTFGRVTTSSFRSNLELGKARLSFRVPENRQFWLAGYHYLKSLIRKGTYRTALEWAKLMYGLNHEDPYGMRWFIILLGVRAHESAWLVEFLRELENGGDFAGEIRYLKQSIVLAEQQQGNLEAAREALVLGLETVPWLYCSLFQDLGIDAPPSIWGVSPASTDEEFWTALFIHQTKDLWNTPQSTAILKNTAQTLDKIDKSRLSHDDPVPGLAVVRLAYLEGQTSLLGVAPREMLERQPNYEFDPLPPPEQENIFTESRSSRLPWLTQQGGQEQAGDAIFGRIHRMMEQRQQRRAIQAGAIGAAAPGVGVFGEADDGEVEENWSDDEELRQDLEAAAQRAQEPGMFQALMDMLGMRPRGDEAAAADAHATYMEGDEEAEGDYVEEDGAPPGAWPEER